MISFAHISDLHFNPLPPVKKRELLSKRIIGYINWQKNRRHSMNSSIFDKLIDHIQTQNIQHLIISGDLSNISTPSEFENIHNWLQQIMPSDHISLVPGNHDAYIRGALNQFKIIFKDWMISNSIPSPLPTDLQPDSQLFFPYIRVREKLAIIGISSAIAMPPFIAAGYFDNQQAKALISLLQKSKEHGLVRVVVLHHPPHFELKKWPKNLWRGNRLISILQEYGAEIVLHGHTHKASQSFIPTLDGGQIPIIGISAACETHPHRDSSGYNLFKVDVQGSNIYCRFERYQLNKQQIFQQSHLENWHWHNYCFKPQSAAVDLIDNDYYKPTKLP